MVKLEYYVASAMALLIIGILVAIVNSPEFIESDSESSTITMSELVSSISEGTEPASMETPAPGFEDVPEMIVVESEMEPEVEEMTEVQPEMMPEPEVREPVMVEVSTAEGSGVPGCEMTDECFLPFVAEIYVGDTVVWDNDDTAAHTVTSGIPAEGSDGIFDSSLLMSGTTFEFTFSESGTYDYFCIVHPWMVGQVQVS